MRPRDYQIAATDGVWRYFLEGGVGNPIIAMPTGTGKSGVCAWLIEKAVKTYPSTRVLVLTHVKELIENNFETLLRIWPTAPAGIYSAGLGRKDVGAQITFAGIASIRTRARLFGRTDLIIIDECHLVSDKETTGYRQFIDSIRAINPALKVIGLSATPYRLGLGKLVDGGLFTDICFDLTSGEAFVWMIQQGYLAPVVPKKPTTELELDSVHIRGGEYISAEVVDAMRQQDVIARALAEALEMAADRKCWLVFAQTLEQTEEIAEALTNAGVKATAIHSKLSTTERDKRLADFKAGKYRAVVNKDILTTGFDHPAIDCIIMLRPTQSPGLWVQMLGRGTRPVFEPGFDLSTTEGRLAAQAAGPKQNCLVLDFAGNTARLGPINYPRIPTKKGSGGGEPPVRVCPECQTFNHISLRQCSECGYEFPLPEKITDHASSGELISDSPFIAPKQEIGVLPVGRMVLTRHTKAGRPDMVRAEYWCGVRRFTTYIDVERTSGPMHYYTRCWWSLHSPDKKYPLPTTVDELLRAADYLRRPSHIKVLHKKPYAEIIDYDFTGNGFQPAADAWRMELDTSQGARPASNADH